KGLARADAYKIAQRNAAKAWDGRDFRTSVYEDPDVRAALSDEDLEEIFSLDHHLRNAGHSLIAVGLGA
ncbi:MAG: hypothetical protein MH204_05135, partial [Fimbriimonadaceae bacterium]|nr:hypothetical protein [Fimbriimonadaceae bacterium]